VVAIIRLIKDGRVLEESDNLHHIHELLIVHDKDVKDVVITVAKHK